MFSDWGVFNEDFVFVSPRDQETTALEVVMLAMREYGLTDAANSGTYSLCEVTVAPGGMVKQRRLPDHQSDIASRLSLCGRLFLRNNMASETLMPDEVAVVSLKNKTRWVGFAAGFVYSFKAACLPLIKF